MNFYSRPLRRDRLTLSIEFGDRYKRNGPSRQLRIFGVFARRFLLISRENH